MLLSESASFSELHGRLAPGFVAGYRLLSSRDSIGMMDLTGECDQLNIEIWLSSGWIATSEPSSARAYNYGCEPGQADSLGILVGRRQT